MPSPDEILPAALALHNSPRRYALLLGSGLSRDTGIRTAVEITDDLICQMAGDRINRHQNPEDWYKETHGGVAPTFTGLFSELSKSGEDQEAVLKPYFELKDNEGNFQKIEPTLAHEAIARLVKSGLISMIITTNFDPLLEEAIRNLGIHPLVITKETDERKMEVVGDQCRIVMVNGKYPNTKLELTPDDLASYDPKLTRYLDRIFSEYGLLICGWSGIHDTGLVEILTEERTRRFAIFWCSRESPEKIPIAIRSKLHLSTIGIRSASEFFKDLESGIELLRRHERRTSLTVESAIKKIKDALRDPRPELMLSDLLHEETDRVLTEVSRSGIIPDGPVNGKVCFKSRLEDLERASSPLAAMVATIAFYDNGVYADLITETIEQLVNIPEMEGKFFGAKGNQEISGIHGIISGTNLEACFHRVRLYPALLTVYASGITSVRKGNFNSLSAILERPRTYYFDYLTSEAAPIFDKVNIWNVLCCVHDWILEFNKNETGNMRTIHDYLLLRVQDIVRTIIPNQYNSEATFDTFEYLYGLSFVNLSAKEPSKNYPLSSRLITRYQGPYFDDAGWIGFRESARKISVKIPDPVRSYFAEIAPKIQGSTFFGGDLQKFERCNRKYFDCFCIKQVRTGIDLKDGRVL
jgi:hypothetical protein